jgi:hypothetical protein
MMMAIAITALPSRCSLYQALLWIVEERPPIEDLIFDSLPDPSGAAVEEKHKRELLVALKTGTIRAEGVLWGFRGPVITLENPLTEIQAKYWEWEKLCRFKTKGRAHPQVLPVSPRLILDV